MNQLDAIKSILKRERLAKQQAELLLEEKSLELYEANQNLKNLNESLEDKIKERTLHLEQQAKELKIAKEIAEKADANKTEFLAKVSHELRTPLNAVVGFTELLDQEALNKDAKEYIEALKVASGELISTVNDVLDWSKIESGEMKLEHDVIDIHAFIEQINSKFVSLLQNKPVKIQYYISDELPKTIQSDKIKLTQILNNLLSNAVKFTNEGSISITIDLNQSQNDTKILKWKVSDTGRGIPKSELSSVFERFKQAHHEDKVRIGGTGLGLSITQKLIQFMGGEINVQSSDLDGTTFSFTIPLQSEKNSLNAKKEKKHSSYTTYSDKRVLVVDDLDINLKLVNYILRPHQIQVDTAQDGEMAVKLALENQYDLILMDLQMPNMTGNQAVIEIRKYNNEVPIVALTANAFEETKQEVLNLGMNDFISKPVEAAVLRSLMEKLFYS